MYYLPAAASRGNSDSYSKLAWPVMVHEAPAEEFICTVCLSREHLIYLLNIIMSIAVAKQQEEK